MKKLMLRSLPLTILLVCSLTSCNKQKASAIKIAVQNFQTEAIASLDMVGELMKQNVSVPQPTAQETIDKIVKDLGDIDDINTINSEMLDFWTEESQLGVSQTTSIDQEMEELKKQYYRFEAIFTSLDKGSFFGKEAVANAEKHALNLTLQLIEFSKTVVKIEVRFAGKRVLMIEQLRAAKRETNEGLRKQLLMNAAQQLHDLMTQERMLRDQTIRQLLKAADAGKTVIELIKGYKKMSANDVLVSVRNTLVYASEITNNHTDVKSLLEKFDAVETAIKEDPHWKTLLDQTVVPEQKDKTK